VTPLARRVAQQSGVDIEELTAQMPGKRITRSDIDAAAPVIPETPRGEVRAEAIRQVRRIIAERMAYSAHTAAPVTLTTEADATELALVRERIKAALAGTDRPAPSYNDLVARLTALALLEHPGLNSGFSGDGIVRHQAVHIGIAVDTEQGLLVPVVRDAHRKSVQQIAAESAQLIERARAGKSAPDDLRGGTFTITNLGMYEIDAFTPIINLPECAILGLGRIIARQVVIDEETESVAIRKMIALSLTFDHRLVDGAPAARFLQQIKRWIEQPYAWLTS
jgi:pyruvate dehydrogenase E2 component (dihydrolipoamide acetyltransferase)